jgi:hypothetical protein
VFHVAGARLALVTAATPVPLNVTGDPVTATLAAIESVPLAAPGGATGENVTVIVQVLPAARVAPHVPPARANLADEDVITIPVRFAPPVL